MSKVSPVKNIDRGRGIRVLGMDVRLSVEIDDTSTIKKKKNFNKHRFIDNDGACKRGT